MADILHSYRPLEPRELDVAMQLSSSKSTSQRPNLLPTRDTYNIPLRLHDLDSKSYSKRFARYVTDLSGGLFEIVEVNGKETVQVIHESVRDFSYGSRWIQFTALRDTATFICESHVLLTKACVNPFGLLEIVAITRHVSTSNLISRLYHRERRSLERVASMSQTPFAGYVLDHIFDHMKWLSMDGDWQYPGDACTSQTELLRSWLLLYSERLWKIEDICESNLLHQMACFVKQQMHSLAFEEGDLSRLSSCVNNLWACSRALIEDDLWAGDGDEEGLRRYYKVFWASDAATSSGTLRSLARSITGLPKHLALKRCEEEMAGHVFILQMALNESGPEEFAECHNVGENAIICKWRITECFDDLWIHVWDDQNSDQRRNVILHDLIGPGYISLLLREILGSETSNSRSHEGPSGHESREEPSKDGGRKRQIVALRAKAGYLSDLPWKYPGEPGDYRGIEESALTFQRRSTYRQFLLGSASPRRGKLKEPDIMIAGYDSE
jgi:hypothetical protein